MFFFYNNFCYFTFFHEIGIWNQETWTIREFYFKEKKLLQKQNDFCMLQNETFWAIFQHYFGQGIWASRCISHWWNVCSKCMQSNFSRRLNKIIWQYFNLQFMCLTFAGCTSSQKGLEESQSSRLIPILWKQEEGVADKNFFPSSLMSSGRFALEKRQIGSETPFA